MISFEMKYYERYLANIIIAILIYSAIQGSFPPTHPIYAEKDVGKLIIKPVDPVGVQVTNLVIAIKIQM